MEKLVEAGLAHTCGLTNDDHVYCWGSNTSGQLFIPFPQWEYAEIVPGFYRASIDQFGLLAAGAYGNCVVEGGIKCWGYPFSSGGQYTPPNASPYDLSVGYSHACYVTGSGALACWGDNSYGRATPPSLSGFCPLQIYRPF